MDQRDRAGKPSLSPLDVERRTAPLAAEKDLPVVARLMVEIRSDGSYTIARGAMEDSVSGQKVSVEASGSSPLALALSLAKSIGDVPWLARQAFRALMKSK